MDIRERAVSISAVLVDALLCLLFRKSQTAFTEIARLQHQCLMRTVRGAMAIAIISAALLTASEAFAACPSTNLTNGTTADATQVMAWIDCKAPIINPSFTGAVGIDAINPTATLTVNGNVNATGTVTCGGGPCGSPTYWSAYGSSLFPTSNSFNVGIGTTSPTAKLFVDGNVYVTGSIGCGGTCGGGGSGSVDWSRIGLSLTPLLTSYNVGIGTASAAYKLDVTPDSTGVAAHFSPSNGADSGLYITPHAANDVLIGSGAVYGSSVVTAKATSAAVLNLFEGGYYFQGDTGLTVGATYTPTMRMVVTPAGNVGIGTASPSSKLHVNGDIQATGSVACGGTTCGAWSKSGSSLTPLLTSSKLGIGVTTAAYSLDVTPDSSEIAAHFSPANGADSGFYITAHAPNDVIVGSGANYGNGAYNAKATSAELINFYAGGSYFYGDTGLTVGSTYTPTLRMVIASNGNVGIGTGSPGYKLHVNGSVAGTGAYNALSDKRLKKNVRSIDNALEMISQLQGVRFRWREPEERSVGRLLNLPKSEQIGFLAQDVRRILPEAVSVASGTDRIMSVAESKIVPVLVAAIGELKAANDNQASEIRELRNQQLSDAREFRAQIIALERRIGIRTAERASPLTRKAN